MNVLDYLKENLVYLDGGMGTLLQKEGLIETIKGKGAFITKRGERKTGVIGLLIPDFSSASFFASLKSELESCAAKLGYKIRLETSRQTSGASAATIAHLLPNTVRSE